MTTAAELFARSQERGDAPETLTDIIKRARFAASWNRDQAEKCGKVSAGFWDMSKDERYTAQQREDAIYSAAYEQGRVALYRDAATFADSIADALIAVTG
jgi:hypothetical protein